RARGASRDPKHHDVLFDLAESGVDLELRLARSLAFERERVIAEGSGVRLQLLVAARDVEQHVLVRNQPVRNQEMLERELVFAPLIAIGPERKLELGLVRQIIGTRGLLREQQQAEEQRDSEQ